MKSLQRVLTLSNFLLAAVAGVLVFAIIDPDIEKHWWRYFLNVVLIIIAGLIPFHKYFRRQRH